MVQTIVQYVLDYVSLKDAAKAVGIRTQRTIQKWMKAGQTFSEDPDIFYEDLSEADQLCWQLYTGVSWAEGQRSANLLKNALSGVKKDPYLALKILQSLDPDQYGPNAGVDIKPELAINFRIATDHEDVKKGVFEQPNQVIDVTTDE